MFLYMSRRPPGNNQLSIRDRLGKKFVTKLDALHDAALRTNLVSNAELEDVYRMANAPTAAAQQNRVNLLWYLLGAMSFVLIATPIFCETISFLLGVRCFLPNNYLVYEATRPISDCEFCKGVSGPLILKNLTRAEFAPYAYSSLPIIVKGAVAHWPAKRLLDYAYLKDLYTNEAAASDASDVDCRFLPFNSDFKSLRHVFDMSMERANLSVGQPWYVGWSVCNAALLRQLRKLYPRPHFLPVDAEMPHADYIFMGYEQPAGAVMHLDYIPRLVWQAQLKSNKSWLLAPTPECDHQCQSFSFYVEPGDAVLVDTRIWYHANTIPKGQFSLTIQSEYG